ncbi:MAG TPA: adenylosuccinate lyase [Flavobacteriaceae bacterium]|nr:adenylosuccinate lyase [Flavobacteriaceae bacterium]
MNSLETALMALKAYKKSREDLAFFVMSNPKEFEKLLHFAFQHKKEISYKAAWVLEMVCIYKLEMIYPQIDLFLKNISKATYDQSVRPFAKICELLITAHYRKNTTLTLNTSQKELVATICFDWLIGNQKVACKAYAMQCLYLLGKEIHWIHSELNPVLLNDFPKESAAYKARARHIIRKISG